MNSKIIIGIVFVVLVIGILFFSIDPKTDGNKQCTQDSDCVVFGKDGDCNCGCYNKGNVPSSSGGKCFCTAPTSCKCVSNVCEGI